MDAAKDAAKTAGDAAKAAGDKVAALFTSGDTGSAGGSLGGGGGGGKSPITLADIQLDYATATQTVFYVMAGVMAVCFVVALVGSPKGKMEEVILDEDESPAPEKPAAA